MNGKNVFFILDTVTLIIIILALIMGTLSSTVVYSFLLLRVLLRLIMSEVHRSVRINKGEGKDEERK